MDKKKQKILALVAFVVGIITLIVGIVFLVLSLMRGNDMAVGEYLVSAKNWVLENEPGVVWDFTEIGKGTLTTNNHENDYDFIWAIDGDELKIETKWLYELEDDYDYELNQKEGVLILRDDGREYKFLANFENE